MIYDYVRVMNFLLFLLIIILFYPLTIGSIVAVVRAIKTSCGSMMVKLLECIRIRRRQKALSKDNRAGGSGFSWEGRRYSVPSIHSALK